MGKTNMTSSRYTTRECSEIAYSFCRFSDNFNNDFLISIIINTMIHGGLISLIRSLI